MCFVTSEDQSKLVNGGFYQDGKVTNLIFTHNLAQALYQWADICLQSNRADRTVTYGRPYGGRSTPTPTFIDALEDAPTFL